MLDESFLGYGFCTTYILTRLGIKSQSIVFIALYH